jgi:hypothetical protein
MKNGRLNDRSQAHHEGQTDTAPDWHIGGLDENNNLLQQEGSSEDKKILRELKCAREGELLAKRIGKCFGQRGAKIDKGARKLHLLVKRDVKRATGNELE